MVGVAGFEPATPTSRTWCATRLRYTPTGGRSYNPGFLKGKLERDDDCRARNTPFKRRRQGDQAAARCLSAGGLVAFPTETVYGLGADARNGEAIARLYAAKGRPAFNPLIAHVADIDAARAAGVFTDAAEKLASAFWPGPLTLVLQSGSGAASPTCAGRARHRRGARARASGRARIARRLRRPDGCALGEPLRPCIAYKWRPCARRSARPHRPHGRCRPMQGRRGVDHRLLPRRADVVAAWRVPREAIERVLGGPLTTASTDEEAPLAPGMLASHYAPKARLRLKADGAPHGRGAARVRAGACTFPARHSICRRAAT